MRARRLFFPAIRRVEWEGFEIPATPGSTEIVVEAKASLISAGTELAIYTGSHIGYSLEKPPFPLLPSRPGYALVGRVIASGAASGIPVGARVMAEVAHGTHAVVDTATNPPVVLPESVDDPTGTLIRMAKIGITALRLAPPTLGESVVVYGAGLVGLFVGQLYRLSGARPVYSIDRVAARLERAADFGLEARVDAAGLAADIVIEATGSPAVIPLALDAAGEGGRVVLLGSPRGRVEIDAYSAVHRKGVAVIGAHERVQTLSTLPPARWDRRSNQQVLARLFATREISTKGLLSRTISPADAEAAYESLSRGPSEDLGIVIDWGRA